MTAEPILRFFDPLYQVRRGMTVRWIGDLLNIPDVDLMAHIPNLPDFPLVDLIFHMLT